MKKLNLSLVSIIVAILIIASAGAVIFFGVADYSDSYSKNRVDDIRETVLGYVAQCYALEGAYPPDLNYLEQNYGLQLNEDKYIYHYEMFATNILPDVQVFAIERASD
ncbi:MAG: hypothetical protein PHO15_04205 [Eubacteriales bacterium]|nr:hypothetical protein [Eubacteriales bacterium]